MYGIKIEIVRTTLKTRGIEYLKVKAWLLFAPPYQNFWLRACHECRIFCTAWNIDSDFQINSYLRSKVDIWRRLSRLLPRTKLNFHKALPGRPSLRWFSLKQCSIRIHARTFRGTSKKSDRPDAASGFAKHLNWAQLTEWRVFEFLRGKWWLLLVVQNSVPDFFRWWRRSDVTGLKLSLRSHSASAIVNFTDKRVYNKIISNYISTKTFANLERNPLYSREEHHPMCESVIFADDGITWYGAATIAPHYCVTNKINFCWTVNEFLEGYRKMLWRRVQSQTNGTACN